MEPLLAQQSTISSSLICGNNFLELLGISNANILVIGAPLKEWHKRFPSSNFLDCAHDISFEKSEFDIIFYHTKSVPNRKTLISEITLLKNILKKDGYIIFFGENFHSIDTLKSIIKNHDFTILSRYFCTPWYYRKIFSSIGIIISKEFIGLPEYQNPEEFVSVVSRFVEIPFYANALYHIAYNIKLFNTIADGRIYFLSKNSIKYFNVIKILNHHLQKYLKSNRIFLNIERFDIRLRGSIVLFIRDQNTNNYYIARMVSNSNTLNIIRRNQDLLQYINNSNLSDAVKKKLPKPICEINLNTYSVFVETLIKGTIAWKVKNKSLENTIFAEAVDFIINFQMATIQPITFTDTSAHNLLKNDIDRIENLPLNISLLLKYFRSSIYQILNTINGSSYFLSSSHGDFGYGNILVNPNTGHITGVIDWDDGKLSDLPGIDYLNLMVQKYRSDLNCGLFHAFKKIIVKVITSGSIDENFVYIRVFKLSSIDLNVLLYMCLIRFMSRTAQYLQVFNNEKEEYLKIFQFLEKFSPLNP